MARAHPAPEACARAWLVALVLAAPLAGARAAAPAPRPVVRFQFGWPVPAHVHVRTELAVEASDAAGVEDVAEATLALRADGPGFRAGLEDLVRVLPGAAPADPPRREPLPFTAARAAMAEFRVDSAGRWAGLVDAAGPGAPVAASVADQWRPVVGDWAGTAFALDTEYGYDDEQPLAGLALGPLRTRAQLFVHRAPPCPRAGMPRTCVFVEVVRRADAEALRRARAAAPAGATAGFAIDGDIADGSVVITSTLLVEPDGLVPHEYEVETVVRVTPARPNVGESRLDRRERRRYEFSGPPAAR